MLSILGLVGLAAAASASGSTPESWTPPANLHYSKAASFRGIAGDGSISNHDVSGHATVLPGVHDFLRLVPPSPLAHGAVFSEYPIKSKEWVVELAFRLHGPPTAGVTEMAADGTVKKLHKGGRGLAFWYTKEGLPGPITLSSNPKVKPNPPPTTGVDSRTDPLVSLFGSRIAFDGLGVVFDTSPNAPLWKRSDPRLTEQDQPWGVGSSGVVSGIMDDGTGGWLDKNDRVLKKDDEAAYLERAIGECEAAFRNAQGLLWARISYVANTIRVDLDLAPHTTLAKAGRDYAHNCFTLDGVNLTPNNYLGISGLASGNTEPDTIDIYAMDVFEVLEAGDPGYGAGLEEPLEDLSEEPLEGTTDEAIPTLTHEIFLSQAKMVEAIDALSRKVESLTHTVSSMARGSPDGSGRGGSVGSGIGEPRAAAMEKHLQDLVSTVNDLKESGAGSSSTGNEQHSESLTHLLQLQDRLMVELKAFGHKLDNSNSASSASLSTLTSRTSELLTLLKQASSDFEKATSIQWTKYLYGSLGLVSGALLMRWREKARRDDVWGTTTRKML
ncbi:legume-like lectin family protein [Sporobolomyces salmoneus]|uniref:legume-like lectin family protein n=1 Tax=Sporobolomyces salmoneus TaxID=183962 RepID=UPI00317C1AC9